MAFTRRLPGLRLNGRPAVASPGKVASRAMILVLGGAGYIGSHMLQVLREAGEPHLVFDNFEYGHEQALQGSPVFRGDLRNPDDIERVFKENPDIDLVMHFA